MSKISSVKKDVEKHFFGASGSHDWNHTMRVYKLCEHIGKKENAKMEVLRLATLLHDIGRGEQDKSRGKICHAKRGAEMVPEVLKKHGFDSKTINSVVHCVERHRFRKGDAPESLESKILFDADKLDSIGAIGIARAMHYAGEHGAVVHKKNPSLGPEAEYGEDDCGYREFLIKLIKVKDRMFTEEGKRIAEQRHSFMENFFHQLNREVDGEL